MGGVGGGGGGGGAAERQARVFAQARARFAAGDVASAAALCEGLLRESPKHAQVRHLHGVIMLAVGRLQEARTSLNVALEKKPDDALILYDLAQVYLREERYEDARKAAERSLRANPNHPLAQAMAGEVAYTQGDFDAGWKAVSAIEGGGAEAWKGSNLSTAIAYGRLCKRFGKLEKGIEILEASLRDEAAPRLFRKTAFFVLGELLDAAGEYERAWGAIESGRALNRSEGRFDLADFERRVEQVKRAWTRERVEALRAKVAAGPIGGSGGKGDPSELAVFVLGMWRSGTTLVEQILSSHPSVHGAGELFELGVIAQRLEGQAQAVPLVTRPESIAASAIASASREYLAALRKRSASAARVTDKMPMNFLHIGLIGAMLPGARVIRCERDPRDIAVSCYFNLPGDRAHYSDDLATFGRFWRVSEGLMEFWESLGVVRQTRVRYETLVGDPGGESRRLVEFIGLDWNERCLRFFENKRVARTASLDQVRRPVYSSSIGRWNHYARFLGPLEEVLGVK